VSIKQIARSGFAAAAVGRDPALIVGKVERHPGTPTAFGQKRIGVIPKQQKTRHRWRVFCESNNA
jgi:hypothetical protein